MASVVRELSQQTLTLGGTRQRLTQTQTIAYGFIVYAESTNTGTVYVGDSSVTSTNGLPLVPGQSATYTGDVSPSDDGKIDLRDVYWDGTTGDIIRIQYQVKS